MNATAATPLSRGSYRHEFVCEVAWEGPLRVGTGERLSTLGDAPLLRDGDGRAYLPGSSVRGVLRDWCEREVGLRGLRRVDFITLFGPATTELSRHDRQGRLTVLDATLHGGGSPEVRDHVKLDPRWGAAADGAKFDQEVVHAARATLRFVYEGDGPRDPALELLRVGLDALAKGALAFGGKSGWGLGVVRAATCSESALTRDDAPGLAAYLQRRLGHRAPPAAPMAAPRAAAAGQVDRGRPPWSWMWIDLEVAFDGPMLVAAHYLGDVTGPAWDARRTSEAPFQTRADGTPVLMGSSLRGALRAHAVRVEGSTRGSAHTTLVDRLFGTLRGDGDGRAGLLRVGESPADAPVHTLRSAHVAIDRASGFAASQRLFETVALASPVFSPRVFVRWHDDPIDRAAVALLLFVLRDLAESLVWLGSRTTRGYGRVKSGRVKGAFVSEVRDGARSERSLLPGGVASLADDPAVKDLLAAWTKHLEGGR